MYCSLDKLDLLTELDGKPVAVQSDHRTRAEIEAEVELSALYMMTRVFNARTRLADDGHPGAVVHYTLAEDPPPLVRDALVAAGATLVRGRRVEHLGPGSAGAVGDLADRCFAQLARRAAARVGTRDLAMALRMLEDQTVAAPPARDDEPRYWKRVLELAALAGELLRAKYPGQWIQSDRALVPFGYQLAAGSAVMFPTNRAQRVIEDGADESLFKLLLAAEETAHHPSDAATGRLMPSLRARGDVELDEVVWRPLLAEVPPDLPIVVCGIDGENTFGMIRREALPRPVDEAHASALANLADEEVDCEEVEVGALTVVLVSGSFYAAEKLLDRAFMQSIHDRLAASLLAAATPARGCLLVTADCSDPATLAQFAALVRMRHDDSGGRSISPAIMLVQQGRIAGYVRGPGDRTDTPAETVTTRAATEPSRPLSLWRRLLGRK